MARNLFPNERFVAGTLRYSTLLRLVDGLSLQVYTDPACTILADIVDLGLNPIALVAVDDSQMGRFYGPDDNTKSLYVRVEGQTGEGDEIYAYGASASAPGSSDSYIHHQDIPSAEWVVNHDLGFPPAVTVVDSAGTELKVAVNYPTEFITQRVVLNFGGATSGQAYLS